MSNLPFPPDNIRAALRRGLVIPAHPLALTRERKLDERRQRALTRYYCAAGAGGLAVGVHTTQFEIREPQFGLLQPVLELAAETIDAIAVAEKRDFVKIAGIAGKTAQAVQEATLAADLGYHFGLVSLGVMRDAGNDELLAHLREIARVIPLMGFYLQPAVGGRVLDYAFWRQAAEIENLLAIKIAPFNRYQTLDVVCAVADSGSAGEIALYTGNDDHIISDLLSRFPFAAGEQQPELRIVGGLLGHWAFWTRRAVELLQEVHHIVQNNLFIPQTLLQRAWQITDSNAAVFDARHNYAGCIPGIHEILRRQGLLENTLTLNPQETLSPGQMAEIDRVYAAYPHLHDDAFVAEHLDEWLR